MNPSSAAHSVQEAVDMAEGGLVHWINSAWAGHIPGDARDFRRAAGSYFDQLRDDLAIQAMPPRHEDCAPDHLDRWARFGDHPLDERIMMIVAQDPAIIDRTAPFAPQDVLGDLVHRLRMLVEEEVGKATSGPA